MYCSSTVLAATTIHVLLFIALHVLIEYPASSQLHVLIVELTQLLCVCVCVCTCSWNASIETFLQMYSRGRAVRLGSMSFTITFFFPPLYLQELVHLGQ